MAEFMTIPIAVFIISLTLYLTLCIGLDRNPFNPFKDRSPKLINWSIDTPVVHKEKYGLNTNGCHNCKNSFRGDDTVLHCKIHGTTMVTKEQSCFVQITSQEDKI